MPFMTEYQRIVECVETARTAEPVDAIRMLDAVVVSATRASAEITQMFPRDVARLRQEQMKNND